MISPGMIEKFVQIYTICAVSFVCFSTKGELLKFSRGFLSNLFFFETGKFLRLSAPMEQVDVRPVFFKMLFLHHLVNFQWMRFENFVIYLFTVLSGKCVGDVEPFLSNSVFNVM